MEMNPIYIGDLEPSTQRYSQLQSEDDRDQDTQAIGAVISGGHQRALVLISLLCCLLLSSNIVLLNLYTRHSSVTKEALSNQTQLRRDNTNLNHNITQLLHENEGLHNESITLIAYNATLQTQYRNLSESLNRCQEENTALTSAARQLTTEKDDLTRSNARLKSQVAALDDRDRRLESENSNLSQIDRQLLDISEMLAYTDSALLQAVVELEDHKANLTAEIASLRVQHHDLALQYSTLERHCHSTHHPHRDHHSHRSTNTNDLTGKAFFFPWNDPKSYITFQLEQKEWLSALTICLRHSSHLVWSITLLSPTGLEELRIQCGPLACSLSVNDELSTVKAGVEPETATTWTHTCATWSSDRGEVQLWVNGVAGQRHTEIGQGSKRPTGVLHLHHRGGSGLVTELHVWDSVLSACEIGALSAGFGVASGNVLNWSNMRKGYTTHGRELLRPLDDICKRSR